jgi:proteasome lid subunit RPN8/RPN11
MITLPPEWAGKIRAEGERAYPNECCGVLLGTPDEPPLQKEGSGISGPASPGSRRVEGIIPIRNARETGEQYHRFEIEPEDLMRAEKEARKQGRDVLGFYHSHPDHPARPSEFDKDHALPCYSYIITAVEKGKAREITSWELKADRSEFTQETVN